jgi:uncharacterized protein YqfA (UPF0365 family)
MKPATAIAAAFLMLICIAHVLRVVSQANVIVSDIPIPIWASVVAAVVTAGLAVLVWREHKK